MLSGLLYRMKEYPPTDFVVAGMMRKQAPKPIAEQLATVRVPVRKGKVKTRGDIRRRTRS